MITKLTLQNIKNIDVDKLIFISVFQLQEMYDFLTTIKQPYLKGFIAAVDAAKLSLYYTQSNDNLFAFWFLSK